MIPILSDSVKNRILQEYDAFIRERKVLVNMKKFMGNNGFFKRAMALLLTAVMVLGYIPVSTRADADPNPGTITTVADDQTLTRPDDVYGSNTLNAGKVTVGKSVSKDTVRLEYAAGKTQSYTPAANNFLVTMTQTAQVMGLTSEQTAAVDVVFVLDTSGSMDDDNKVEDMVDAANAAIKTLLAANPNNRVGVVAFSGVQGGGNSGGNAASVLTPLGHYDGEGETNHIYWVYSNGTETPNNYWDNNKSYIRGRGENSGYRDATSSGTNIHAGVALGGKLLAEATNTTVDGVTRIPFLVIMSDGQPSYAASGEKWYDPNLKTQLGNLTQAAGLGFLPALTAAYYKGKITEHYYGAAASSNNRCYVYTMGLGLQDLDSNSRNLAYMTMDPSNTASSNTYYDDFEDYYAEYLAEKEFKVSTSGSGTHTITKNSITDSKAYVLATDLGYTGGYKYNDDYFDVSSGEGLGDAFTKIVNKIQEKSITSPTYVSTGGDKNFDGYVTFTDPIGEYMEVKDIKGILANGHIHAGNTFAQNLVSGGNASFNNTLKNVLKKRMSMTGSTATDDFINNFIASAKNSPYQANYTNATNYDNSIVWWGKEYDSGEEDKGVQVLGHANNDTIEYIESMKNANGMVMVGNVAADYVCRSYFFVCDADATHELMYLIVRVQRELVAPYKETVVISVPASLLSVSEVLVNESTTNSGTTYTAEVNHQYPLRVTYEVGLRSDINAQNVDSIVSDAYRTETVNGAGTVNYNSNGTYNFFTNDWDRSESVGEHHRAQAKATFDAAADNSFYAYQEDTLIVNQNGNAYTGNLSAGQELYYAREYYEWTGDGSGSYTATKKSKLIKITIPDDFNSVIKQVDGKWYISKGVFTASTLEVTGDDTVKADNKTGTSAIVSHAHRTGSSNNSHYTVLLGNNGLLTLVSEPAKTVSIGNSTTNDNGKVVTVGETLTYTIKVSNTEASAVEAIVQDTVPAGTVLVANSQKVTNAAGETVNATFENDEGALKWKFDVPANQSVNVSFTVLVTPDALSGANDVVNIDNTATIKVGNNPAYTTNKVSNPPEGKKVVDLSGNDINGQTVKVGDVLTYRIRVQNDAVDSNGRPVAADVTVTDIIPAGTTFKSATHDGVHNNGTVTWSFTDSNQMAANASVVLTLEVYVDASAKLEDDETKIKFPNQATIAVGSGNTQITRTTNEVINYADVGKISISKAVRTNMPDAAKEFDLVLTEATGKLNGEFTMTGGNGDKIKFENGRATTTIKKDQVITVEGLPMGATIMVAEVLNETDDKGWEVKSVSASGSVTVSASTGAAAGDVIITNAYTPMPVEFQLKGQKKVDNANFPDGVFTFVAEEVNFDETTATVSALDGRKVHATAVVDASASLTSNFAFTSRVFTDADLARGTFYYTIEEAATTINGVSVDPTKYLLKLVLSDDNAQLKIDTYIQSSKDNNGNDRAWTAFDPDDTQFTWKDNTTTVVFKNTYTPAATSVTLEGTKTLDGRNMMAGEFSFQLVNVTSGTVVATANNTAANNGQPGTFTFAPLNFTEADMVGATDTDSDGYVDKTFTYAIREVQGTDSHITYDKTYYEVIITVKDVNGQLTATPTIKKWVNSTTSEDVTSIAYTNTYHTQSVSISLSGTKTLTGAAANGLNAEDFTFEVVEATVSDNGEWSATSKTASTGANGTETSKNVAPISFANITYSVDMFTGTDVDKNGNIWTIDRYYIAKEVIPANSEPSFDVNMKYDQNIYKIHVQVQLNTETGVMTANIVSVNGTAVNAASFTDLNFKNIKNPDKVYFAPTAKKTTTTSADLLPENLRFAFRVTSLDGTKLEATGLSEAAAKDAAVNVNFTQMEYSQTGTYLYLIEETAKTPNVTNPDIIYDATKYVLAVVVSRDDNNKLTATGKYYDLNGKNPTAITTANYTTELSEITTGISFTNTFNVKKTLNISVTKELTGNRDLNARAFDFRLELLNKDDEKLVKSGIIVNGYNEEDGDSDNKATVTFGTLLFTSDQLTLDRLVSRPENDGDGDYTYQYHLLMSEIEPSSNKLAGVTYDKHKYIVVLEMKVTKTTDANDSQVVAYAFGNPAIKGVYEANEDGNGYTVGTAVKTTFEQNDTNLGVTFKNSYTAQTGTSVTMTATKQLTGAARELQDNEFSFELYRWHMDGSNVVSTLVETATNKGSVNNADSRTATVTFTRNYPATIDSSFFDTTGIATFIYQIKEIGGTIPGMTYSTEDYWVEVKIKHNTNNACLEVESVKYYADCNTETLVLSNEIAENAAVFTNNYTVKETAHAPVVQKELLHWNGQTWVNDLTGYDQAFSFELVEVDEDGNIIFINSAGETVAADATGAYAKVIAAANNDSTGAVKFANIPYTAAGTYYYMIREVVGTDPNIDYNDGNKVIYMKVVITDQNSELAKSVEYGTALVDGSITPTDNLTFTNYYGPYQLNLELNLQKEVVIPEGGNYKLQDSEFDFEVYKYNGNQKGDYVTSGTNVAPTSGNVADIVFGTIQINQAQFDVMDTDDNGVAEFKFLVEEINTGIPGIKYETSMVVIVTVEDKGHGNLVQTGVTYSQSTTQGNATDNKFTNLYETAPAVMKLPANKILIGKDLRDNEFNFVLSVMKNGAEETLYNNITVTNGEIQIPEIKFTAPGTYTYKFKELTAENHPNYTFDKSVYTIVVVVTDDGKGQLHEVHTIYKDYVDNQTNEPVGGISFTNMFTPDPITKDLTAQIGGMKKLVDSNGSPIVGRDIPEFTFLVTDALGNEVKGADGNPIIGKNDADGKITFSPAFKFDAEGEYHYYITEQAAAIPGYTVDSNVWALHILVRYNSGEVQADGTTDVKYKSNGVETVAKSGELYIADEDVNCSLKATATQLDEPAAQSNNKVTFVNVYEPEGTYLHINTTKKLTGRDLKAGEFTFHLARKNAEGNYQIKVAQTTNDAEGKVQFHVNYSLKDLIDANGNAVTSRTFEYEIHEEIPETGLGGVTYTTARKYIKVKVEDIGGKLQATIVDSGNLSEAFSNSYKAKDVKVDLRASKVLTGANIADMSFTFELVDCYDTVKQTVTSDTEGKVVFEPITIRHADMDGQATKKFVYTIREKAGQLAAMTYDETVYTATVEVTDDQNGNLIYTVTYTKDGEVAAPVFHNTYDASTNDTFASIKATKELTGKTLAADEFTFELVDKTTGEVVQTAKNTSTGDIVFTVPYTTAGSYSYILREVDPKIEGMAYDKTTYEVTVEVKAGDDGRLSAEVTYKTESGEAPVFKNIFTPGAIQVTLDGKKELEGRSQTAGEFKFEVRDGKGNLVATGTNDAEGNIIFTAITFDTVGKYELKVAEVDNKIANVTYDAKVFDVTVEIVNDNGVLKATVTKPEGGIKFRNTYTEPATEAPTEAPTEKPTEKPLDPNNPDTGDRSNLGLPVVLLMVSLMGILIVLILMKSSMKGKYRK